MAAQRRIVLQPGALVDAHPGTTGRRWLELLRGANLAVELTGLDPAPDAEGFSPVTALRVLQADVAEMVRLDREIAGLGNPIPWVTGTVSMPLTALIVGALLTPFLLLFGFGPAGPGLATAVSLLLCAVAVGTLLGAVAWHNQRVRLRDALRAQQGAIGDRLREAGRRLCDHNFVLTRGADLLVHTPARDWLLREEQAALPDQPLRQAALRQARLAIEAAVTDFERAPPPSWSTAGLIPNFKRLALEFDGLPLDNGPGGNKDGGEGSPLPSLHGRQCSDG